MGETAKRMKLHRAAWVVTMDRPPVCDGGLLVRDDRIVAAGPYGDVRRLCPSNIKPMDHGDAALMPAVVNGHTHLELTALAGRVTLPQPGFAAWVQEVFRCRSSMDPGSAEAGFHRGVALLDSSGVAVCGDIANSLPTRTHHQGESSCDLHPFLELIGFDCDSVEQATGRVPGGPATLAELDRQGGSLAAHAVYSTSAAVIQGAKRWCAASSRVFSIHAAEHAEEVAFLRDGTGFCRELLQGLGRWVDGWTPPDMSPVAYLDSLDVLDERTLLVHAVHLTGSDWETIASRGCAVCFCPRSNHYVNAGKADVTRAERLGIRVALGTDSLASNTDLNLFAEAAFLLDHWPELTPDTVLAMMTLGGADALGYGNRCGSLTPGKRAAVLTIPVSVAVSIKSLSETLIHKAKEGAVAWAIRP